MKTNYYERRFKLTNKLTSEMDKLQKRWSKLLKRKMKVLNG